MAKRKEIGSEFLDVSVLDDIGYGIADYDYDRTRCTGCEDYCRCTSIINARVTSVNFTGVADAITTKCTNELRNYCAERFLRHSDLDDLSSWEVNVCGGYYGEEVNGVRLDDTLKASVVKGLQALNAGSPKDMVQLALTVEYGHVLPVLENIEDWAVEEIDYELIDFPNRDRFEYTKKMDSKLIESYKDHSYPRGVCVRLSNGRYRLIDGYHRCQAIKSGKVKMVVGTIP